MNQVDLDLLGRRENKEHQEDLDFPAILASQEDQEKEVYQERREKEAPQVSEHKDPEAHRALQDLLVKVELAAQVHQDPLAHEAQLVMQAFLVHRVPLASLATVILLLVLGMMWEVDTVMQLIKTSP